MAQPVIEIASEIDWEPPPVIPIVESEVLEIPTGLPPLDEFIRTELENEELAKEKIKKEIEAEEAEVIKTETKDQPTTEIPIADDSDEDDLLIGLDDAGQEDEFEMPMVEVKKQKVHVKHDVDGYGMENLLMDFDSMKKDVEKEDTDDLQLRLIESTNNFLNSIIERVVEICEYEDPDDILRARLDKDKLKKELDEKLSQLELEQKVRLFLNRKTVEYFRRKKATRPLMDDNPEVIVNLIKKYRDALMKVNKYKGLYASTTQLLNDKTLELKMEMKELEKNLEMLSEKFVNSVKKTLITENAERLDYIIDYMTRNMNNLRREISEVRCVLLQRQHTMAGLQEKAKRLDDLGNGLHMADFEHLQTETQALGKKIEERNSELSRLHARCNADIHTLAHIREKVNMMRTTIVAQQEGLDDLLDDKQRLRSHLHILKIQRSSLRKELKRVRFQSGILDSPELLDDYDITDDKVNNLRAEINRIKAKQAAVDEKLQQMAKTIIESKV